MSARNLIATSSPVSLAALLTGLVFGLAALVVVSAGLTIPMPGTRVVTDPRELFATIGAALGGPIGGILVGVLAGIAEPVEVFPSLLAHVAGGLWMGLAYKKLVYSRLPMPALLLGWAGLVLAYYCAVVLPGFIVGQAIFSTAGAAEARWQLATLLDAYTNLWRGALPEMLLTTFVTTLALAALPRRYRRPLW